VVEVSTTFRRFAGVAALGSAASGLLYAVAFIIVARRSPATGATLAGLFLLTGGLFSTVVMSGLYRALRDEDSGFAVWALLLGVAAVLGSAIHGGYDLANGINPPADLGPSLPSQVDPRGLLTFGVFGISVLTFSWLIHGSTAFRSGIAYVGYLSALLVEMLYLGRLVIVDATSPLIVGTALLAGFIVNPLWYAWLGVHFLRSKEPG
jgi:hypothetical protein